MRIDIQERTASSPGSVTNGHIRQASHSTSWALELFICRTKDSTFFLRSLLGHGSGTLWESSTPPPQTKLPQDTVISYTFCPGITGSQSAVRLHVFNSAPRESSSRFEVGKAVWALHLDSRGQRVSAVVKADAVAHLVAQHRTPFLSYSPCNLWEERSC